MKLRLVITIAFGLLHAAFGLFNQKPVEVILLGVTTQVSSLGMFFLYSFLVGVFYAGIIAALGSIRLRGIIARQARELEEVREKHEDTLNTLGYTTTE
ncbi:MAG: hypothetical protein COB53_10890 [Elusimicrobia bacterium]|nr:MAG: hypothetical protein COB53_10890 [Elusimicrobiota bacterium]